MPGNNLGNPRDDLGKYMRSVDTSILEKGTTGYLMKLSGIDHPERLISVNPKNKIKLTTGKFNTGYTYKEILDYIRDSAIKYAKEKNLDVNKVFTDMMKTAANENVLGYGTTARYTNKVTEDELFSNWYWGNPTTENDKLRLFDITQAYKLGKPITNDDVAFVKKSVGMMQTAYDNYKANKRPRNAASSTMDKIYGGIAMGNGKSSSARKRNLDYLIRLANSLIFNDPAIIKYALANNMTVGDGYLTPKGVVFDTPKVEKTPKINYLTNTLPVNVDMSTPQLQLDYNLFDTGGHLFDDGGPSKSIWDTLDETTSKAEPAVAAATLTAGAASLVQPELAPVYLGADITSGLIDAYQLGRSGYKAITDNNVEHFWQSPYINDALINAGELGLDIIGGSAVSSLNKAKKAGVAAKKTYTMAERKATSGYKRVGTGAGRMMAKKAAKEKAIYNAGRNIAEQLSMLVLESRGVHPVLGDYYFKKLTEEMAKRGYGTSLTEALRSQARTAKQNAAMTLGLQVPGNTYDMSRGIKANGGYISFPTSRPTLGSYDTLSLRQRAQVIKMGVKNGMRNLESIQEAYNKFALGGVINTDNPIQNYADNPHQLVPIVRK